MYEAQISEASPSALIFLVDQSASMGEPWGAESGTAQAASIATILNRLLQNLVLRCAREEGVRDYYSVAVIGYGAAVGSALGGSLAGEELVPLSKLASNPIRVDDVTKNVDDGAGGILEQTIRLPIWVEPKAGGSRPMTAAMAHARALLEPWVQAHPDSFPPIVLNISDGAPTDGDPTTEAEALKSLATTDGNVLLVNTYISAVAVAPMDFPSDPRLLPDDNARVLFVLASPMPDFMRTAAAEEEAILESGARALTVQGDAVATIRYLDIGTRRVNLAAADAGWPDR